MNEANPGRTGIEETRMSLRSSGLLATELGDNSSLIPYALRLDPGYLLWKKMLDTRDLHMLLFESSACCMNR